MSALTQILKAFSINGLSSGTTPLGGTEEVPIWQSSSTVKVTVQDIADLASGSNLGNADLTASAAARKFILNGDLSTDYLTIRDGSDTTDILKVQGDQLIYMNYLGIGTGATPSASYPVRFNTTSAIAPLYTLSTAISGTAALFQSSGASSDTVRIQNTGTSQVKGLEFTITGNASVKTGIDLPISGTATSNIGIDLNVSGGTNNYAIRYTAGDEVINHSGTHKKILGGALSTDEFTIRNSADSADFLTVNGEGQVWANGKGSVSTNTVFGEAGGSLTSGGFNAVLGYQALNTATTQTYNVAIGHQAMQNATASQCVAVGHTALQSNTGNKNTSVGVNSMTSNTSGNQNTAVGHTALNANSTGIYNTAVGHESLRVSTSNYNTAIGHTSGYNLTGQQTFLGGFSAGYSSTSANHCTMLGTNSGYENTTGDYNTFLGSGSGRGITTGSYNTVVGVKSGLSTTLANHVIISDGQENDALTKDNNGNVWFSDNSALATTATNGFVYVRGGAGIPTGTPATSVTGHVPMYADTTNNKLYIYSGGSWVALN